MRDLDEDGPPNIQPRRSGVYPWFGCAIGILMVFSIIGIGYFLLNLLR